MGWKINRFKVLLPESKLRQEVSGTYKSRQRPPPATNPRAHAFSRSCHDQVSARCHIQATQKLKFAMSTAIHPYARTRAKVNYLLSRKPNCGSPGAACLEPRFIGADGIVFYFHGKSNEYFSLVSDPNHQINARFIGLRPACRPRDYIRILFDSQSFSVEATKAATWDDEVDHLKFLQ
ncbi:hypothetical protein ACSBR1_028726 [Camellia fascicularis]